MSTIDYRIAVQTRGFNEDYRWFGNSSGAEQEARDMGAVLHNMKPGIMIRKFGDDIFGVLIADIERPDATDRMGTRIRMQIYVGGLSEAAVRSVAVAALENWENVIPLRNAVVKAENEREWDADFQTIFGFIQSLVDRLPVSLESPRFSDRLSGKYDQRDPLITDLRGHRFSDSLGYKFYWGGIPSKDGEELRFTVDRYFCTNATPGVLLNKAASGPIVGLSSGQTRDGGSKTSTSPVTGKPEMSKKVLWGMVAVIILLLISNVWSNSSNGALKKENSSLTQQNQELEKSLKNAKSQIANLQNELSKIQNSLKNAESQKNDLQNELQKTQSP